MICSNCGAFYAVGREPEISYCALCYNTFYPRPNLYPNGIQATRVGFSSEGLKFDSDKPYRPELIAPEYIFLTSEVLAYGAKKYAPRNWEKGMAWSRPFGALMRHMWAWWRGEKNDPETNLPHLAHASCCLMFLLAYEQRSSGTDDRFITTPSEEDSNRGASPTG